MDERWTDNSQCVHVEEIGKKAKARNDEKQPTKTFQASGEFVLLVKISATWLLTCIVYRSSQTSFFVWLCFVFTNFEEFRMKTPEKQLNHGE